MTDTDGYSPIQKNDYGILLDPTWGAGDVNGNEWNYGWHISNDGIYSITLKPKQSVQLVIYVQLGQDANYSGCIGYDIE